MQAEHMAFNGTVESLGQKYYEEVEGDAEWIKKSKEQLMQFMNAVSKKKKKKAIQRAQETIQARQSEVEKVRHQPKIVKLIQEGKLDQHVLEEKIEQAKQSIELQEAPRAESFLVKGSTPISDSDGRAGVIDFSYTPEDAKDMIKKDKFTVKSRVEYSQILVALEETIDALAQNSSESYWLYNHKITEEDIDAAVKEFITKDTMEDFRKRVYSTCKTLDNNLDEDGDLSRTSAAKRSHSRAFDESEDNDVGESEDEDNDDDDIHMDEDVSPTEAFDETLKSMSVEAARKGTFKIGMGAGSKKRTTVYTAYTAK
jgi:hypothetical protein